MSTDLSIDRLEPDEWLRYKNIRLASLKDSPDAFGSVYAEVVSRPDESWKDQVSELPTFVAVLNHQDVGTVRFAKDDQGQNACWLISMWVHSDCRGKGIGDALIQALLKCARDEGYTKMFLDVGDFNLAATKLYERNGFVSNGVKGALPSPRSHITERQMERVL